MKIAIGIFRLLPRGGLEDHALRIADELARRGHEITLHTTGRLPDVDLATVALDRRRKPLTNHGRMTAFAADFKRATQRRFDRIVGFQPMPGIDVLFLADHLRNRPDASLLKRLSPRFRAYARLKPAVSRRIENPGDGADAPQMQAFIQRYPSRARVAILPPTIAKKRAANIAFSNCASNGGQLRMTQRPTWLWLGLQPHVKGLDRVVEALAQVPPPPWSAASRKATASFGNSAGRRSSAFQPDPLARLSPERSAGAFAAADVLAHPARVDVTGAVILEALINGLPVVATDCCGFAPHVERSGAGALLGSPFDAKDLVAALAKVCGPENATFSANGIAYGESPELYSGLSVACDLIEAAAWPRDLMMAADPGSSQATSAANEGGGAWSR